VEVRQFVSAPALCTGRRKFPGMAFDLSSADNFIYSDMKMIVKFF
jgi:hypothetical protein